MNVTSHGTALRLVRQLDITGSWKESGEQISKVVKWAVFDKQRKITHHHQEKRERILPSIIYRKCSAGK